MSKHRIYELAKEFDTTSKVIMDILARNNMAAKNHMSSVDDASKQVIERTFARKTDPAPEKPVAVKAAPPAAAPKPVAPKPREPIQHTAGQSQQAPAARFNQPSAGGDQRRSSQPPMQRPQQGGQQRPQSSSSPAGQNRQQGARPNQRPYDANRPQQNGTSSGSQQRSSQPPNRPGNFGQRDNRPPSSRPDAGTPAANQQHRSHSGKPGHQQAGDYGKKPQYGQRSANNRSHHNHHGNQTRAQQQNQHQAAVAKMELTKPKLIKVAETVTIKDLAIKMGREVSEVIKKLMMMGIMATINQEVDFDTATLLAGEFSVEVEQLPPEEDPTEIAEIEDDEADLVHRPPVVTVMGHVDHGKTSLLDAIRKTQVTAQEAGGITQHIGAYQVQCHDKRIVFLDTPGHEAFTAMRARGAQVTDIAILVVAADDGVMPQTIEAINHAKSANVPILVAINKMDRPGANPDKVKQQLAEHALIPEDWGGETIMVPVSAHQKTGIDELLEMVLLVAEMQDIKANPRRPAYGVIIEAQLDKGRGTVATVLVQKGTLHVGDSIIAGTAYGKVRAMLNDRGEKVKKAEPSTPVEVLGLTDVPQAGDILVAVEERVGRAVAEKRIAKKRTEDMQQSQKVSLDDLFKQIQDGNIKDLNIIIKADVQGSIEALCQALLALNEHNKEVRVNVVHAGVGAINDSDVLLASASNGLIIGFNVRPDANSRKSAETEKVDIRLYRVIYDAINDVETAMKGMLAPEYKEVVQGRIEVRKVFTISKAVVAGCYVLEGKITNSSQIRVVRNGIVVHEGEIEALKRFKDDVKEVATSYECGISVEKYRDIKEGDIIEAYTMEEVKRTEG